jgi:hypothetical protein
MPSLNTQNLTDTSQMLMYFLSRVTDILSGAKVNTTRRSAIIWADLSVNFVSQFGNDAVIHVWQNVSEQSAAVDSTSPRPIVSSVGWSVGQPYRLNTSPPPQNSTQKPPMVLLLNSNRSAIVSGDPSLLYPQVLSTWPSVEDIYWNEPFVVQGNYIPTLRILGGELLVWSFDMNSNNFATVWHRMAAVAERLWIGPVQPLSDSTRAKLYLRLNDMNCRLARRGKKEKEGEKRREASGERERRESERKQIFLIAVLLGIPTVPLLANTFCDVVTSDTSGGTPPAPPPQVRYVQYGQYRARHLALVGLFMGVFGIMIGATAAYCWNSVSARFSQHRTRMQRLRDREMD